MSHADRTKSMGGRATRADRATAAVAVCALAPGVALLLATSGVIADIIGGGLIGLAGVAFTALAFLIVGESEDRDRDGGLTGAKRVGRRRAQ
jgi:hypothetical protein